jgi:hypothetical protein
VSEAAVLPGGSDLGAAFDAAIDQARQAIDKRMISILGEPAEPLLQSLISKLETERARAIERGRVDREWFQITVRWVVDWAPESDLLLIAALGKIARVTPKQLDK